MDQGPFIRSRRSSESDKAPETREPNSGRDTEELCGLREPVFSAPKPEEGARWGSEPRSNVGTH